MRKESTRILFIEIILFIIISFVFLYTKQFHFLIYILFLLIPLVFSYFLLGIDTRRGIGNKDVFLSLLMYGLSYYFITYVLGYFSGFLKTTYSTSFIGITSNVFLSLFFFLIIEFLRWSILSKCHYLPRRLVAILVVLLSLAELVTKYNFSMIGSKDVFLKMCFSFLPILSKNILLSYIVYYTSIINSITYRLIMDIPIYFLPIFPDFGDYLSSLLLLLFPIFLFLNIQRMLFYPSRKIINSREKYWAKIMKMIGESCSILLLAFIILLVSGYYRFYALSIGSNSMANKIRMGDVVIIDQKKQSYEVGDIIAYRHHGTIIIHRIYSIRDGFYQTKGDNNSVVDDWIVFKKDILGIVRVKIPWLGWPTVKLNQWIMDGE